MITADYVAVPASPTIEKDPSWAETQRDGNENASIRRHERWRRQRWCITGLLLSTGLALIVILAGSSSTARSLFQGTEGVLLDPVNIEEDGIRIEKPLAPLPPVAPSNTSTDLVSDKSMSDRLPDNRFSSMVFSASTVEQLDKEFCGVSPCSFLIAARVNEQETKAQQHLGQLAMLAKRLKRTLVLPNVNGGRYAVCRPHSFDFYHDVEAFNRMFDLQAILWKDFVAYSRRRQKLGKTLSSQLIVSNHDAKGRDEDSIDETFRYKVHSLCGDRAALDFDLFRPVEVTPAKRSTTNASSRLRFGRWLAGQLERPRFYRKWHQNGKTEMPDALFLYWGASRAVFLMPGLSGLDQHIAIPFHSRWRHLVDRLAERLHPFIALHWRQESLSAKVIPDFVECAKLAEGQVESLGAKSVYFMTDFPLEGDQQYHSDSYLKFLRANPAYREAAKAGIDHLVEHFHAESAFHWTTCAGEKLRIADAKGAELIVDELDTGLSGIIDKMMAERAEHYLVGEPYVCGRHSSYALQIVAERTLRQHQPGYRIKSPVDYFPRAATHRFEDEVVV